MTTIQLLVDTDLTHTEQESLPSNTLLRQWIGQALDVVDEKFESDLNVELSVRYCNSDEMSSLNSEFREQDRSTNVLSFPSGMPTLTTDSGSRLRPLGDIVLCPEVIEAEALDQSKTAENHYCHLVVHGVLHLCGYDHIDDPSAEAMELLEIQILSGLGIANPYRSHNQ